MPVATSAKILAAMYARVPQAMAQFVLKIENCPISWRQLASHADVLRLVTRSAPTPILEMARAYGLRS